MFPDRTRGSKRCGPSSPPRSTCGRGRRTRTGPDSTSPRQLRIDVSGDVLRRRWVQVREHSDDVAADVVVYGDGGGKAPSWREPIYGRERVAKLMAGTLAQGVARGAR